ncbi:MAG: S1-C subfamily serine protease [Glaciecola sp.]|jgi:S1-C subfamily serine protease
MNLLDALIVLFAVAAATGGYRRGLIVRVFSWVGAVIGMGLGLLALPTAMSALSGSAPESRLLAGLAVFVVIAGAGAGAGDVLGQKVRARTGESPLRDVDRFLGAGAGIVSLAIGLWLVIPAASVVPGMARQVRTSDILTFISDTAPRPPDTITALRTLIGGTRFPEVFDDLRPAPETGPAPSEFAMSQGIIDAVVASSVNVEAFGCGSRFEGSGWAAEPGIIVTNAHVVAGADEVRVRLPDGRLLPADVVAFDDNLDLAVLSVSELRQEPLDVVDAVVGEDAAVVGYPGGQDTPRPTPARVNDDQDVTGRDIYGRDRTTRRILFTSAQLRQGDSGSPLFNVSGQVIGTIFAVAPDDPDLAYALHAQEIRDILGRPRATGAVGPCA